jgi:hypothetical protein
LLGLLGSAGVVTVGVGSGVVGFVGAAKTGPVKAVVAITAAKTDKVMFLNHLPIALLLYHT